MVAVTADQVVIELIAKTQAAQADLSRYGSTFNNTFNIVQQGATRAERTVERSSKNMAASFQNLARSAAGYFAAGFGVNRIKEYLDTAARVQNQLKVAGLEGAALSEVQEQLFDTAQRYGVELERLSELYGRTSQGAKELGASSADLLKLTNSVAAAIKIQGGAASSAAGALVQLTQALGGEIVRAEEFNSINEGARPLLQAVADNIDRYAGSVARLRADVIEGKLTSEEFFNAIVRGSDDLEEKATKANLTFAATFTRIENAIVQAVSESNTIGEATDIVIAKLNSLADNIDEIFKEVNATIRTTRKEIEFLVNAYEGVTSFIERNPLFRLDVTDTQRVRNLVEDIAKLQKEDGTGFGPFKRNNAEQIERKRKELAELLGEIAAKPIELDLKLKAPDYLAVENIDTPNPPKAIDAKALERERKRAEREMDRFNDYVYDTAVDNKLDIDDLYADITDDFFAAIVDGNKEYSDNLRSNQAGLRQYNQELDRHAQAILETLDPMRRLAREAAELEELFQAGRLTLPQYQEALDRLAHDALLASDTMAGGFARALDVLAEGLSSIDVFAGNIFGQIGNAFKSAINSMIADALRLNVIKPLLGGLFGAFGGGSGVGLLGGLLGLSAPPRDGGGHAQAGKLYRVNERGGRRTEYFQPAVSGKVIPLGQDVSAGGGKTIIANEFRIDMRGAITTPQLMGSLKQYVDAQTSAAAAATLDTARKSVVQQSRRFEKLGTV